MITIPLAGGQTARFDDTGVDREHPGRVYGALLAGRFYEQDLLAHVRDTVRGTGPGEGCYLDLGAAIGTHTLWFALACGATRVHAFEPRGSLFDRLAANVELNGLGGRVVLHRLALSDTAQPVALVPDGPPVRTARLDRVVTEPVVVVKVDVDGMEPQALRGAARLLRRDRPLVLVAARRAPDYEEVVRVLRRVGYRPTGRTFGGGTTYEFTAAPAGRPAPHRLLGRGRRVLGRGRRVLGRARRAVSAVRRRLGAAH